MSESMSGRTYRSRSLRETRFVECDLSRVVIRGSDVAGMEIDSPWLLEGGSQLFVNGVDVAPLVDAELNARFPGRELRTAQDPAGLQAAYAAVEAAWAATLAHARSMPAEAVDASVDGEWSLTQTMRHLILATDLWLGQAVLGLAQPFDPIGLPNEDGDSEAFDRSFFATASPSLDEVMAVRITRQQLVRDYLARVTAADLAVPRPNPHAPTHQETTLSCIGTILEEEWEHHRYVVRDLDALAAR